MANETKLVYGTAKTLEGNGASVSDGAYGTADDADYTQTDTLDYPDAEFMLYIPTLATAPGANKTISLFIRPLDIDGSTNHAPVPSSTFPFYLFGVFPVENQNTAAQRLFPIGRLVQDIPRRGRCYIRNNLGGSISIPSGWKLILTPLTKGPV